MHTCPRRSPEKSILKKSRTVLGRLFTTFAIAALVAVGSAEAQEEAAAERFAARVPPDWKTVYQYRRGELMLAEFLPQEEEVRDWRTMLSYEYHGIAPWIDPIEFVENFAANQAELCEGFQSLRMSSGLENGYPTAVWMLVCPTMMASGKGRVTLLKAVQGTRGYYIAALMRRVDQFKQEDTPVEPAEIAAWGQFMREIVVCMPGDDEHPCPQADT